MSKVKLLFDASIFLALNQKSSLRNGVFFVGYNLIKKFAQDERFEITLFLKNNIGKSIIEQDEFLKKFNIINEEFVTGASNNFRKFNNPKFKISDYDAYYNIGIDTQLLDKTNSLKQFYTLHDAIPLMLPELYDDTRKYHFREYYNNLTFNTYCFCVSKSCKNDYLKIFKQLDENKMFIAYNASSQEFTNKKDANALKALQNKYNINESNQNKYIFFLGFVGEKRKNIIFSIKAFLNFINENNVDDLSYYLGGCGNEEIISILETETGDLYKKYKDKIVLLGYIDDEDVNTFYSNSLFFVYPSLYEGFGMPILEAMQAGIPVISSNASSMPEVLGDAGIYFSPIDMRGCIDAMKIMYNDSALRKECIEKGYKQINKFGWDKTYTLISDKIYKTTRGK